MKVQSSAGLISWPQYLQGHSKTGEGPTGLIRMGKEPLVHPLEQENREIRPYLVLSPVSGTWRVVNARL